MTDELTKEIISNCIKGQIAFKGGFHTEEDVETVTNAILFGLSLQGEE